MRQPSRVGSAPGCLHWLQDTQNDLRPDGWLTSQRRGERMFGKRYAVTSSVARARSMMMFRLPSFAATNRRDPSRAHCGALQLSSSKPGRRGPFGDCRQSRPRRRPPTPRHDPRRTRSVAARRPARPAIVGGTVPRQVHRLSTFRAARPRYRCCRQGNLTSFAW